MAQDGGFPRLAGAGDQHSRKLPCHAQNEFFRMSIYPHADNMQ
jgi:hypothetical protein